MTCKIIDAKALFDAIRDKEDEFRKAANIITMDNISTFNKNKIAKTLIKSKSAQRWYKLKLVEYEYTHDDDASIE